MATCGIGPGVCRAAGAARRVGTWLCGWLLLATTLARGTLAQEPPVTPREPIEVRLGQSWRWRFIDGPKGSATVFRVVRPGRGDGLLTVTADGVRTFDGWSFTEIEILGGLQGEDEVRDIAPLQDGFLLVIGDEIASVDPSGSWGSLWQDPTPSRISNICRRADGNLDIASNGFVTRATLLGLKPLVAGPPESESFMSLVQDEAGSLWATTERGVFRQIGGDWVLMSVGALRAELRSQYRFAACGGQEILFLPEDLSGLQTGLHWDGHRLEEVRPRDEPIVVADLAATPDGDFIVASRGPVLNVFRDGKWHEARVPLPAQENVVSICMTPDQRLAAVFASGRLAVCDLGSEEWQQWDTRAAGVGGKVNAIAPSVRGGLWLATDEGLVRFHDGRFTDRCTEVPGVALHKVTAVCEDPRGGVWIGSGSGFAGALCLRDGRWTRHAGRSDIGDAYVHAIRRIGDDLWFLLIGDLVNSWGNGGAVRLRDGVFERFTEDEKDRPLPRTYDIAERYDGTLVVGLANSLRVFDGQGLRPDPEAPFADRRGFALHETSDGTLWVGLGLRTPGLSRLRHGTWEHLRTGPWQRAAAASFAETPDGTLWFASELGLFQVRGDTCSDVSARRPLRTFWPLLSDGTGGLWVGSLGEGLLHFRPGDVEPPRVRGLEVNFGQNFPKDGALVVARWDAVDRWNSTPPEELSYVVELDGTRVKAEPSPQGGQQFTTSDLPAGNHEVRVWALDSMGNVSEPKTHSFEMPPPLWRTPPVLLAAGATTLVLLWLLVVIRNRRRERALATAAQHELNERLSTLTLRLLSSQEDERRNISREMHDDLGQLLTAACLDIERASRLEDLERRREALRSALRAARDTQQRVREISHMLRPTELDDHGLSQAVATVLSDFTSRSGIDVESRIDLDGQHMPVDVANHVFRILQEALTNILRHAHAGTAFVTLQATKGFVELRVRDDGVGFEPHAVPAARRFGLLGMRERAELLGGKFSIRSQPAGGTEVSVSIPIPHR